MNNIYIKKIIENLTDNILNLKNNKITINNEILTDKYTNDIKEIYKAIENKSNISLNLNKYIEENVKIFKDKNKNSFKDLKKAIDAFTKDEDFLERDFINLKIRTDNDCYNNLRLIIYYFLTENIETKKPLFIE